MQGYTARILHHRPPNSSIFSLDDINVAQSYYLTGTTASNGYFIPGNSSFRVVLRHDNHLRYYRHGDTNNISIGRAEARRLGVDYKVSRGQECVKYKCY